MLSRLRKGLIYTDTDPDVLDHDDDLDAEMYTYEKRQVYRGRYDPRYTKEELDVHWLYDENSKRVGLVEYESADFSVFSILWYYDNPYSTLLQEPEWKSEDKTLWSMLSNEAYQDCLESDFKNVIELSLGSPYRLVFPSTIGTAYEYYECAKCNKKTLSMEGNCSALKKVTPSSYSNLFLDDSFIVYTAPADSRMWSILKQTEQPPYTCRDAQEAQVEVQAARPVSLEYQSQREVLPPLEPVSG
jgi:hypothetical protein